ncbi:MAG: hypothetical protein MZV70_70930 [Desulfobacterales bacterium]|nr:hypothetical protein [Desulfobacterales bacterium]
MLTRSEAAGPVRRKSERNTHIPVSPGARRRGDQDLANESMITAARRGVKRVSGRGSPRASSRTRPRRPC